MSRFWRDNLAPGNPSLGASSILICLLRQPPVVFLSPKAKNPRAKRFLSHLGIGLPQPACFIPARYAWVLARLEATYDGWGPRPGGFGN
jgi:hypothetical protein